jgi:hypothetical protein
MPATRPGFDSVLSRQPSFLRRIRENLQSVWTLPRVVLAVSVRRMACPFIFWMREEHSGMPERNSARSERTRSSVGG